MSEDDVGVALDAASAEELLASYGEIGTHYVAAVEAGDRIFQVFAYEDGPFRELEAAFEHSADGKAIVQGIEAMGFEYYTTPLNEDTGVTLGYVSDLGRVLILSADADFDDSLDSGVWHDETRAEGNSIFMAYVSDTTIDLSGFASVVPIGVELAPLGDLISVEKNPAGRLWWNRLLNGVFQQKHGQNVHLTWAALDGTDWRSVMPAGGRWLSTIATPTVSAYAPFLALGRIQLTNRDAVERFSSWSVVMSAGKDTIDIPGETVSLSSYLIDVAGPDGPPTIRLASRKALDGVALACGRMGGAMTLANAEDQARKTLMDGIVLATTGTVADTGRSGVAVEGDLFGARKNDWLSTQTPNLNFVIVSSQTLLYTRGETAAVAEALARDCLDWITGLIPNAETTPDDLLQIRLRAAYLAKVARRLEEEGTPVPYLTYASYSDYIKAMSTAASTLRATVYEYQTKIAIQRNAELAAKNAEEINQNVKTTGELLGS